MHRQSSRSAQRQTRHFSPRYATTQIMCCLTFCLRRKSRCTVHALRPRVHDRVLPETDDRMRRTFLTRMLYSDYSCLWTYIILYVLYNDICSAECSCNCEIKSILTYLLTIAFLTFLKVYYNAFFSIFEKNYIFNVAFKYGIDRITTNWQMPIIAQIILHSGIQLSNNYIVASLG